MFVSKTYSTTPFSLLLNGIEQSLNSFFPTFIKSFPLIFTIFPIIISSPDTVIPGETNASVSSF
ncbi:MAG: hypothetical protein ACK52J_01775 [bacterium]